MRIDLHVWIHDGSDGLDALASKVDAVLKGQNKIMAAIDTLNAALGEANTITTEIAADIEAIKEQLTGGVTAAEAAELQAKLDAHVQTLKGVAALYPVANPEEPPVA